MKNTAIIALIVLFSLSFLACSSDDDDPKIAENPGEIPGLGEAEGTPQGDLYEWPEGISLIREVIGGSCDTISVERGSGYYVTLCVGLYNNRDTDTEFELPAGLIWIAEDSEGYQSGMLLQKVEIELPSKKEKYYTLGTYCVNANKSSSSSNMTYHLGPVTNSSLIRELIGLLKDKKINIEDYPEDSSESYEAQSTVQSSVWAITDGDGLTDYYKAQIQEIPDK